MLYRIGNQMKDFDTMHDLKRERIAGRDHDGLVVLRRQTLRWHRYLPCVALTVSASQF